MGSLQFRHPKAYGLERERRFRGEGVSAAVVEESKNGVAGMLL
jgi:hypothetical protein